MPGHCACHSRVILLPEAPSPVLVDGQAESKQMSQIASFTVLKASDVPRLGFWSKPKPRLFRKPECRFEELLKPYVLREQVFEEADGSYVALTFAWLESLDKSFSKEADPVIGTVRKNLGGSHWLLKFADQRLLALCSKPFAESERTSFMGKFGVENEGEVDWDSVDAARLFLCDRLSELKPDEALLIAIG